MASFSLTVGLSLGQCQYKVRKTIFKKKTSRDPLPKFYGRPSLFFQSRPAFLLESDVFPNCLKGNIVHLWWSHSVISCRCTIVNRCGNTANQYPAYTYWKCCSVHRSWAFSEGDVKNCWSVTGCHLTSPTLYSWEQQHYLGAKGRGAFIKDNLIKSRPRPSLYHEATLSFLSASRIRVALRPTRRRVFVRMTQRCLVATGLYSRQ